MRRFQIMVRHRETDFVEAWVTDAPSISALLERGEIGNRLAGQPYDDLRIIELRDASVSS